MKTEVKKDAAKRGALRVWWIPQVPGTPFLRSVKTLAEAKLLLDALGDYDLFQLAHRVKPDYANAGGLSVFDGKEWVDWLDTDGNDIDSYSVAQLRKNPPLWGEENCD